jgi:penicillin-binding protein 1C
MQTYYDDNRIAYEKIPPHNPLCDRISGEAGPAIRFPKNGTEYFIDKKAPEPLKLSCEVGSDVKTVYWYINNKFYKRSDARARVFFTPEDARIKISCTDDKGRNNDIWIKVKYVNL